MTPAEELRAAATTIREAAALATPGPWQIVKRYQKTTGAHVKSDFIRPPQPGNSAVGPRQQPPHDHDDYAWIVLMGPDKAFGIAALLDHYAGCVAWSDNWDDVRNCGKPIKQVARSILGGVS